MTDCFNNEVMTELTEIMGDDMAMLVSSFIKDTNEKLSELSTIDLNDHQDRIFRLCHSLKGSSRNVGVAAFSDYCEELELLARQNELTSNHFDLTRLQGLFVEVEKELTSRFL